MQTEYFFHTQVQAIAFIEKVKSLEIFKEFEKIEENTKLRDRKKWENFGKLMKESGLIKDIQCFYIISLRAKENYKTNKEIPKDSIFKFLEKYLNFSQSKVNPIEFGEFEQKKPVKVELDSNMTNAHHAIQKEGTWYLYTYGEKTVQLEIEKIGEKRQITKHYIKERPVKFIKVDKNKFGLIQIINTDDAVHFKQNKYSGKYTFFTKLKKELYYYLETDPLDSNDNNDRHLRLSLCFGKLDQDSNFGDFGIGTFSGIRDGGAYFSGAAILIKKSALKHENDDYYKSVVWSHEKARIHESLLKNPEPPLKAAIRMLLEKRNKSFIKLPKGLTLFTLEELKQNLLSTKYHERAIWEAKDLQIYRTKIFISNPLFYESKHFETNTKIRDKMIEILTSPEGVFRYSPNAIEHGLKKIKVKDAANTEPRPKFFESNFDHISQSQFFILILPNIAFPNENISGVKISTSLLELGFAWGQRKKILVLCTSEMKRNLPKILFEYDKNSILIVAGDLENEEDLSNMIEQDSNEIIAFFER